MAGVMDITLERDGHDQPWGFRLQGGYDVGVPLSVQRVLVGTPADGFVKKGDIILTIGQADAKNLSHQQAADLFTNTGNLIVISIKRAAKVTTTPAKKFSKVTTTRSTTSAVKTQESQLLNSLTKTRLITKISINGVKNSSNSSFDNLNVQNQPKSILLPSLQPTAKLLADVGPGSASHLKMQADIMAGFKEFNPAEVRANVKGQEFALQRKVTGTLQQIHQQSTHVFNSTGFPSPLPITCNSLPSNPQKPASPTVMHHQSFPKSYNSPINLYSSDNVAEVARINQAGYAPIPSMNRLITPNKPQQISLNSGKEYNPTESATWRALQESTDMPAIDPEKLTSYSSLKEHDPIYSEVYTVPKLPQQGGVRPGATSPHVNANNNQFPQAPAQSPQALDDSPQVVRSPLQSPGCIKTCRSPVADLLPASHVALKAPVQGIQHEAKSRPSAAATFAEPKSSSQRFAPNYEKVPIYENNAIGGTKRITQSATFNKLMMDVLGL